MLLRLMVMLKLFRERTAVFQRVITWYAIYTPIDIEKRRLNQRLFQGLYTLTSFDTLTCASKCDQASGCQAFNMYIERDPSLDPNAAVRIPCFILTTRTFS